MKSVIPEADQGTEKGRERGMGVVLSAHREETFHAETDKEELSLQLFKTRRRFKAGEEPSTKYMFKVLKRESLPWTSRSNQRRLVEQDRHPKVWTSACCGSDAKVSVSRHHSFKENNHDTRRLIQHFLEVIERNQIPLYCDRMGHPPIELPLDPNRRPRPLRSQTVRSWICTQCFLDLSLAPTSGAIQAVLNVLEGHAWKIVRSAITDDELALVVEQDSLLQTVLEFMKDKEQHTQITTELMRELKNLAQSKDLLKVGKRKWPGASWVFSHRLKEAAPLLDRLGIGVTMKHTNAGNEVTLTNSSPIMPVPGDAPSVTESHSASQASFKPDKDLGRSDASSGSPREGLSQEDAEIVARLNRRKATRQAQQLTENKPSDQGKELGP